MCENPFKKLPSGANPTALSYNASALKIYNATRNLVRFENKNMLSYFEKRSSLLQRWRRIGPCNYLPGNLIASNKEKLSTILRRKRFVANWQQAVQQQ
jgi:hypothetical protein